MAERFVLIQTRLRCFQVFDLDARTLSTAKGRKTNGKITAYITRKRAEFCVKRLRDGRQTSPYEYRLKRKRAWPTTEAI